MANPWISLDQARFLDRRPAQEEESAYQLPAYESRVVTQGVSPEKEKTLAELEDLLRKKLVRQSLEPDVQSISNEDYLNLTKRAEESPALANQSEMMKGVKNSIARYQAMEQKPNLKPVAALLDSWTGSNVAPSIQAPETPEERQQMLAQLQGKAAQLYSGQQDDITKFLKENLIRKPSGGGNELLTAMSLFSKPTEIRTDINRRPAPEKPYDPAKDVQKLSTGLGKQVSAESAMAEVARKTNWLDPAHISDPIPGYEGIEKGQAKLFNVGLSKEAIKNRAFVEKVIAPIRNKLYGGALTPQEAERFDTQIGDAINSGNGANLRAALISANEALKAARANIESGVDPRAVEVYQRNLKSRSSESPQSSGPSIGEVRKGPSGTFKFKGGDPRDKNNWVKQ